MFDITLAYGILARFEERDNGHIAIANGGSGFSANIDDGNLNYDTGIVSNMVKTTGELTLVWSNFGVFARGFVFYDFENELNDRARTELSDNALEMVGKDAGLLDHYLSAKFHIWGMPVLFRLGDQLINWGETTFLRNGLDVVNPLDLVAAAQPTSTPRDFFIPQGMLWGAANVSEIFSVEGFYQYDWEEVRFNPVGSFFSANDLIGGDGLNFAMIGSGLFSDQGTDLDERFGLPPGTLGFDPDFMKIFGNGREEPGDLGQYGFSLRAIAPELNATKFAFHFVNYHSRLPLQSFITPDQNTIDATSPDEVAARAAELEPIYVAEGLSPDAAAQQSLETAEALTTSNYANNTRYFAEYPEDILMFGFSFNTSTVRTGTLLSGEVSHHLDYPLQIDSSELITAAFSPIQFDAGFPQSTLGSFGANEIVTGFIERDKTQAALEIIQLFGPRFGAAQTLISTNIGWIHIHDMPDSDVLALQPPGSATADSWGYHIVGQLNYSSVFGGLNLKPRIVWGHDVNGTTPGPYVSFLEGRKSLGFGLGFEFANSWTADMSYTTFFGAGQENLLHDRDFIRFRLAYSF